MREKKLLPHPLQLRLSEGTSHKLKDVSKRTGLDVCSLARLALNSGLVAIAKTLPPTPRVDDGNNSVNS